MEHTNKAARLLRHVLDARLLGNDGFTLIDVGCALGIDQAWRVFGDQLRAYAFDPQADECDRLTRLEENPAVRYFANFVGLPEDHPHMQRKRENDLRELSYFLPFGRTSAMAALAHKTSPAETEYGRAVDATETWGKQQLLVNKISLSDFVKSEHVDNVDFIKSDTDGSDLEVMISAQEMFRPCGVLGCLVETNFQGSASDTANTMHNIDRVMRQQGFMLYDMTSYRYSRASLPAIFAQKAPYQTVSGQPMWGDFLYLRDGSADDYRAVWGTDLPLLKLLKLACLYELFSLPDCAAELILKFRDAFASVIDPDVALDLLTPPLNGRQLSYAHYRAEFDRSYTAFYPGSVVAEAPEAVPADAPPDTAIEIAPERDEQVPVVASELTRVRQRLDQTQAKLTREVARRKAVEERLAAVKVELRIARRQMKQGAAGSRTARVELRLRRLVGRLTGGILGLVRI